MSLDPYEMLAALFVSGIGFVLFKYGRRMSRFPHTAIGLLMLVYPFFVSSIPLMLGLVPVFLVLLWLATRFGL